MALRSAHGRRIVSINAIKNLNQSKIFAGRNRARCISNVVSVSNSSEIDIDPQSVLFISPVWPERSSSAAGVRSCDLISSFQKRNYAVNYASPSTPNEHTSLIQETGVNTFECPPNNATALAAVLQSTRPSIVIFDRFYAEEMFSFRVKDMIPEALRVLDMQDVHFLREGRQLLTKQLDSRNPATIKEILKHRPDATFPSVLRELASIYRSDLTLVCSPVELTMLREDFNIPHELLVLAPFFAPPSPHTAAPVPWSDRKHLFMIGNFRHPPNFDSVRWTCREIWPLIRENLGMSAELHLYGSYAPQAAAELNNPVRTSII
jgi:hypothetical protein